MRKRINLVKIKNYYIFALLTIFCLVSITLHIIRSDELCLNEDEAAQGYNTYSVIQTGKDEFGKLSIRYLSFGENKLPLTGLLSAPFIWLLGLSELTVRLPVYIIGTLFPVLFYFATYSITKDRKVALIASFLSCGNVWLQTMSRHQHEAVVLAAIVLIYIAVLFWVRQHPKKHIIILSALTFLGLYTYHSAKIIMPALAVFTTIYIFTCAKGDVRSKLKSATHAAVILAFSIVLFLSTELISPNNRLTNLSYFTNPVFTYEIEEGRRTGGSLLFYNKPVYGTYRIISRTFGYLTPDYLIKNSDPNPRYGAKYLPLITHAEYILFIVGAFYSLVLLFKHKFNINFLFLYFFIFVSILPASLALPESSSTRSYLLLIPLLVLAGICAARAIELIIIKTKYLYLFILIFFTFLFFYFYNSFANWHTYFEKYLSDPATKSAWQCGMDNVARHAWSNYDKYDQISITRALGQPYIFLLFYGGPYPPEKYQSVAKIMPYNEYGFFEQERFDKFYFTDRLPIDISQKSLSIVYKPKDKGGLYPLGYDFYTSEKNDQ